MNLNQYTYYERKNKFKKELRKEVLKGIVLVLVGIPLLIIALSLGGY